MNRFECPFSLHARKHPKRIALISEDKKWSYLECEKIIEGAASELRKEGVKKGDAVALFPTKSFPSPLLFFALFRLGAIACPINTYHPLETLPQKLDALRAPFFLIPDGLAIPKIKQITLPFSKLLHPKKPRGPTFLDKKRRATLLGTSGTTATPKIACHSLGNHYYSALGSSSSLPIHPGNRYLLSLPLYHIAGVALLFRTFMGGGAVALSEEVKKITHISLVPTQLYRLLKSNEPSPYKHILLGGATIAPSLFHEGQRQGLVIHPTYGMTEMSSQITTHFESDGSFSLGHPLPYRKLKLSPEGDILVKGETLFQGYLQSDGSLDLPLTKEGYFRTGDIGSYCPKKGLQLIGRKDRLFISGGENIQPEEIEGVLSSHKGIISAKVVPIADEEFGMRPSAYIESDSPIDEEALKGFLKKHLPTFKIPVKFSPKAPSDP